MPPFVNRSGPLAALATQTALLQAGEGSTVVVRGPAGQGTSALLHHWVAGLGDVRVLEARGVESEADLPFAGLASLVTPILDLVDELPDPQPAALRAALALGPATGHDRFTAFVAVVGLLSLAARSRPLVVAVDDVHHLDSSSLEALAFASRRLDDDPVLCVLAGRTETLGDPSFGHAVVVELPPLSSEDARLVLQRSTDVPIHPAVSQRLVEAAGGNPSALVELTAMLSADELRGTRPLADPLPVGRAFQDAVARQLAGLPEATRRALLIVAAGEADGADDVRRALAEAGHGIDDLVPAEHADLLVLADRRHRFRDEQVRAAVVQASTAPDRRRAHQALADVLDRGSRSRAAHAAAACVGTDGSIAAALERVAVDADERGDAAAAWHAWERSADLSPDEDDRCRRLIGAAQAALAFGSPDAAQRLLDDAEARLPDQERDAWELLRGRLLVVTGRPDAAAGVLAARADRLAGRDPTRAAGLLLEAVPAMLRNGRIGTAVVLARRALDLAGSGTSKPLEARAAVALGAALGAAGEPATGLPLLDRYRDVVDLEGLAAAAPFLADTAALAFVRLGEHDRARTLLDDLARAVGEASAPYSVPGILAVQGFLDYRTGRLADAAAASSAAVQIADETNQPGLLAFPLGTLVTVQAMRGDERSCRAAAERLARLGERQEGGRGHETVARSALGLLELGLGRPERAVVELEPLRAAPGPSRPSVLMWEADLADALVRCGRPDDARAVIGSLESSAERSDDDRARAAATRLRALVAPDAERVELLELAIAAYRALGLTFGLARSLLDLGACPRRLRQRKAAREPLQEALALFAAMTSTSWSALAAAELDRCGGRTRSAAPDVDPLTPQERQVARLVADGASNREVASRLFLSVRTVESHLSRIYRKVGLRSRTELTVWVTRTDAKG